MPIPHGAACHPSPWAFILPPAQAGGLKALCHLCFTVSPLPTLHSLLSCRRCEWKVSSLYLQTPFIVP